MRRTNPDSIAIVIRPGVKRISKAPPGPAGGRPTKARGSRAQDSRMPRRDVPDSSAYSSYTLAIYPTAAGIDVDSPANRIQIGTEFFDTDRIQIVQRVGFCWVRTRIH